MRKIQKIEFTLAIWWGVIGAVTAADLDTPYAINTQKEGEHPASAEDAAAMMTLPEGFEVEVFAGDPDVHQPVAFDIDDRGRLWVVECYTYEGGDYDLEKRDRILIFEDTDGDGKFDKRKIFWDKGHRVMGMTLGFGGVWMTCAPHLLFLPDRDGDDVPDGEPEVLLEGFSIHARHNMVNGLRWGPDGWLYGRHGITDTSTVGTPETPQGRRVRLNCSIWRYHPQRRVFEVLCNGTTNPWGLDYNEHGQWFFTNNVVNHLWHMVPGAHYQRMFGDDFNPHLYRLIQPTADHFHWDTGDEPGESWNKIRKEHHRHTSLGGGHSHSGAMFYQGDNWPEEYRGILLMCNTHGKRVNADRVRREGNSYVGTHGPDFLMANTPWFVGVELKYGPDGGVFLTDWSDLGECHDRDGVHRTSGRIYKITYPPVKPRAVDLKKASDEELAELQLHANDWFVRHARRLLQERAVAGADLAEATRALREIYEKNEDVTRRLRAMWALYSIGAAKEEWLVDQLGEPSEHIRSWAVRLLVDQVSPGPEAIAKMTELASADESGLVRLYLASAMQRLEIADRWELAKRLAGHAEDVDDRVQPLMTWYGIEAAIPTDSARALDLAMAAEMPLMRRHIARRLTVEIEEDPAGVVKVIELASGKDRAHAADYLEGMVEALQGRHRVSPPGAWEAASVALKGHTDERVEPLRRELAVVFGDGRAVEDLLAVAMDGRHGDPGARRDALRVVIESRPPGLLKTLLKLKGDRVIGADAIRGLARYDDPQIPKQLLSLYPRARHDHRPAIIETLASRPNYAAALLDALEKEVVNRVDIPAAVATTIAGHNDEALTKRLEELWGAVRTTSAEKKALIAQYIAKLPPDRLAQANPAAGRLVYTMLCGSCHKMFGEGGAIGPDLTGSNRDDVGYLLENIIDPSGVVPTELRLSVVTLKDSRVIVGSIVARDQRTVTIQTIIDQQVVERDAVQSVQTLEQSLMPEGLLMALNDDQVRDLIAYLQTRQQVSLPGQ